MEGFIQLHRKIMCWDWYDDLNTFKLFIHCLLKANHKDKNWRGNTVKRGTFITSTEKLSKETGLTIQQVRTSLKKLEKTSEINKQTTNLNTCISMVNYNSYQGHNKQTTNKQQTNNKQVTTTNNDNNDNNEYKTITYSSEIRECYEKCILFFPEHLRPKDQKVESDWLGTIEKLSRIDGIPLNTVIEIVKKTREDDFWSGNFLTLQKLRKKKVELNH